MNPVPEAETVVVGAAPEEQDDAKDNQPKNGNDLDRRKPELGFSEKGDRDDIENQDDYTVSASASHAGKRSKHTNKDNRDPCCDRDGFRPILNDQSGSRYF